jgi:hypothetical protein
MLGKRKHPGKGIEPAVYRRVRHVMVYAGCQMPDWHERRCRVDDSDTRQLVSLVAASALLYTQGGSICTAATLCPGYHFFFDQLIYNWQIFPQAREPRAEHESRVEPFAGFRLERIMRQQRRRAGAVLYNQA